MAIFSLAVFWRCRLQQVRQQRVLRRVKAVSRQRVIGHIALSSFARKSPKAEQSGRIVGNPETGFLPSTAAHLTRAGLNCGACINKKSESCKDTACCDLAFSCGQA